jgi:regulator of CtrA degradation
VPIRYIAKSGTAARLSPAAAHRYAIGMTGVASINSRIVEALYVEALVLADAARARFESLRETPGPVTPLHRRADPSPDSVELTCEALRTTTRVMHCLAWLLNHRAWFAGQISAVQLRRHGRLISHFPASDPLIVARLPEDLAELVWQSERLYARIQRLEQAWREVPAMPGAIERLRDRLAQAAVRHG